MRRRQGNRMSFDVGDKGRAGSLGDGFRPVAAFGGGSGLEFRLRAETSG